MFGAMVYGLVGAVIGSFLNVVIDRIPAKQSLLKPSSHCPSCGTKLLARDMIPVFSYVLLGGKCRVCGAKIPRRVLWVECSTALLFAFLFLVYGLSWSLILGTVYACILLVVLLIDLEHKLILDVVILPAIGLGLLAIPLGTWLSPRFAYYGIWDILSVRMGWKLSIIQMSMMSQLLGGAVAFLIFLVIWLISPQGMGDGDIRLAAFSGLITGFPGALAAVFGSFILGGLVSVLLLLSGRVTRKTAIPFAPFLVITTLVVYIFGDRLLHMYLGF